MPATTTIAHDQQERERPITEYEWSLVYISKKHSIPDVSTKTNNPNVGSWNKWACHYFTGEYPIKPSDNLEGLKIKQLSLLSGKSNN